MSALAPGGVRLRLERQVFQYSGSRLLASIAVSWRIMAIRLHNALPLAAQLIGSSARRLRGLSAVDVPAEGDPFIIVAGPGRSGTSAVARVLHESGLSMGSHFRDPTVENATGFYEELPVCYLNDKIMAESGMAGIGHYPMRSTVLVAARRYTSQLAALADTDVAGWKDPRFGVTLEAWLPHLPGPPKLIICLRSSEAYLHSISQMFGLVDRDIAERWWTKMLRRLLDVARDYDLDATCVEYDDLVTRPAETVAELSKFVGKELDASHVEPKLRHFAYHIPHRLAPLYNEVRALGPHATTREVEPAPATPEAVDAYMRQIGDVDTRVESARNDWSRRIGAPDLHLVSYLDRGLDSAHVYAEGREASQAYVETLSEAQVELGVLIPPAGFGAYHEATRAAVNDARLVAQLTLEAAEQRRAVEDVTDAYRLRLSPEALAKKQKRRSRELERARRAAETQPAR